MLVVFRAGWCRFSSEMMQGALLDPQIVELSRQCICVMVDADRSADTCRALGIQGFPTVLVVAPNGKETFRTTGRPSVQAVAAAMQHVLKPARMAETDEVTSRTQNF
jgi:thioredoxin-like negative regulator of GroEL